MNGGQNSLAFLTGARLAGGLTLISALLLVTPFCGYLFSCGCTWPGAGLAENCNYFIPASPRKCPWCQSFTAGMLSIGLALVCACLAAITVKMPVQVIRWSDTCIVLRILFGLAVFLLTATLTGWIAADPQGYFL